MDCFPLTLICFLSLSSLFLLRLSSPTARFAPVPVAQLTIPSAFRRVPYLPYLLQYLATYVELICYRVRFGPRLDAWTPVRLRHSSMLTLQLYPAALPPQRPDLHTFLTVHATVSALNAWLASPELPEPPCPASLPKGPTPCCCCCCVPLPVE